MKKTIKATINYTVDGAHPDIKGIRNPKAPQHFTDLYTVDTDYFYSLDELYSYIRRDLAIIAGGGYNADHIHNVTYSFKTA